MRGSNPMMSRHSAARLAAVYLIVLGLGSLGAAAPAQGRCATDPGAIASLAAAYLDKRPVESLGTGLAMSEALCVQEALVERLEPKLGKPIGYKVGLTSKAVQELFGASAPVRGVLFESVLLPDGAEVPAAYGARPVFEPDLLVTVRDEGVNRARTPLEVAEHLTAVIPFIELADLAIAADRPVDAGAIVAVNVGARLGVTGRPVPALATPGFVSALAEMTVIASDGATELSRAQGKAILGHPLNAVIWLAADLARTGKRLKAGDVVSLGSFARPQPPRPGQTVTVRYEGLPTGPRQVSVTFR